MSGTSRALPYDAPVHPGKRHSAALTHGPERAGARSMLKAMGFTDDDLAKPIIGVATTWIETMPCNLNQRRLAEKVKEGIRAAGGTPMEFNTIAVSDGVSMGTEGMKASLISREVVADSIELVARGHLFDGLVLLVGCDKTNPAGAMAAARLDLPTVILYNGTIYPGTYKGQELDIVSVYEAIGAYRAGKIALDELYEIENRACPGAGACGGQYTANTMSMVLETLGLSPAGLNGIAAEDPRKDEAARRCGELVMELIGKDLRPSQIVDRRSIENAIAMVAATGGSTNGVLHLLAIASEFLIPLEIDDFDRIAARTPLIADMRPGGRFRAAELTDAGGVELVMRELLKKDLLHGDAGTIEGRTIADIAAGAKETPGQEVVQSIENADQAERRTGDPARLARARGLRRQAGRPRATLPPWSRARLRLGDRVLCGGACPADQAGRCRGHPLRGPGRRSGHAGDAAGHGRARRRGAGRVGGAADRWPVQRRHPRTDGRPRRTRRSAGWADRVRARRRLDRAGRRQARAEPRGR